MAIPLLELEKSSAPQNPGAAQRFSCVIKRTGEDEITCTFPTACVLRHRDRLLSSTWTAVSAEAERLREAER